MLTAALCALMAVLCGTAGAAGIVTHAWMADDAAPLVSDAKLAALLAGHRGQLRSGAAYPDSGYVMSSRPGGDYGEEAHWQRFVDAYADRIKGRKDCGDLRAATGPCADEVAHLMGVAAHGMGDQVWDWLMEPSAADHGESYVPKGLSAITGDGGGTEFPMDMVAIARHHRPTDAVPPLPSVPDLLAAYRSIGRADITGPPNVAGNTFTSTQLTTEGGLSKVHASKVEAAMPWSSSHIVTGPGGVRFGAVAIAGYYEDIWARLLGREVPTRVSITYPADGQHGVAATGWTRDQLSPGARGGGATNRIVVALTRAVPFQANAKATTPFPRVPAAAMTLAAVAPDGAETPVVLRDGFPRSVPYGPDAGEHLVDVQPAADLQPCTTYRVRTTAALVDAAQRPVTPATWAFRTGTGATGARCADDPAEPDVHDPASVPYRPIAAACTARTFRITVRTPRGMRAVRLVVTAAGRKTVRRTLRSGTVLVPVTAGAGRTTVALSGRLGAGAQVGITKTLPGCDSKKRALTLDVR